VQRSARFTGLKYSNGIYDFDPVNKSSASVLEADSIVGLENTRSTHSSYSFLPFTNDHEKRVSNRIQEAKIKYQLRSQMDKELKNTLTLMDYTNRLNNIIAQYNETNNKLARDHVEDVSNQLKDFIKDFKKFIGNINIESIEDKLLQIISFHVKNESQINQILNYEQRTLVATENLMSEIVDLNHLMQRVDSSIKTINDNLTTICERFPEDIAELHTYLKNITNALDASHKDLNIITDRYPSDILALHSDFKNMLDVLKLSNDFLKVIANKNSYEKEVKLITEAHNNLLDFLIVNGAFAFKVNMGENQLPAITVTTPETAGYNRYLQLTTTDPGVAGVVQQLRNRIEQLRLKSALSQNCKKCYEEQDCQLDHPMGHLLDYFIEPMFRISKECFRANNNYYIEADFHPMDITTYTSIPRLCANRNVLENKIQYLLDNSPVESLRLPEPSHTEISRLNLDVPMKNLKVPLPSYQHVTKNLANLRSAFETMLQLYKDYTIRIRVLDLKQARERFEDVAGCPFQIAKRKHTLRQNINNETPEATVSGESVVGNPDTSPTGGISNAIGVSYTSNEADRDIWIPIATYDMSSNVDKNAPIIIPLHPRSWFSRDGYISHTNLEAFRHVYFGPKGTKAAKFKITSVATAYQNARYLICQIPYLSSKMYAYINGLTVGELSQYPRVEHTLHGSDTVLDVQWTHPLPFLPVSGNIPFGCLVVKNLEMANSAESTSTNGSLTIWVNANDLAYSVPQRFVPHTELLAQDV
jgi:hypothetical protein